jgi:hypothetical protein
METRETKKKLTDKEKGMVMVAAKAFFDDGQFDDEYPFTDVSEQYDEFVELLADGGVSWEFIKTCYEWNSK